MLTLRYVPKASAVLHLHPTLVPLVFVQALYSLFLIPRNFFVYRKVSSVARLGGLASSPPIIILSIHK